MGTEPGEPPGHEERSRASSERVRDRVAEGRASLAEDLRAFASELADAETTARREQDARIESMVDERLAAAERKLNASVATRLDAAVSSLVRDRRSMLADWANRAARAADIEARVEITLARLVQGVGSVEAWMVAIGASERRILEAHTRLATIERSVADWATVAQRAADWERRISRASAAEAEAAKRILDAERRLRDRL